MTLVDTAPTTRTETVAAILHLDREFAALPDLNPGSRTDALFTELVALCCRGGAHESAVLADPGVRAAAPRLRLVAGAGEYLLERHWAEIIGAATDPEAALERFPYLANYRDLTRLELGALAGVGVPAPGVRRVCFLGGGPLPLSAILLARELDCAVDVVDRDHVAVGLAERVVQRVAGPGAGGSGVVVHHGDAAAVAELRAAQLHAADLVVLAALVGADGTQKREVLRALRAAMAPGAVLMVRSARGLRTLLYPEVDPGSLSGFRPLAVVHPWTDVVNSVVVARAG